MLPALHFQSPLRRRWAHLVRLAWTAVPLLVLTIVSIQGIEATKRATREIARTEVRRALDQLMADLEDGLASLRGTAAIPINPTPEPAAPNAAQELYKRAEELVSKNPAQAADLFIELKTKFRDALFQNGLPILPFAEYGELETIADRSELKTRALALARDAVETHPSIASEELLVKAKALLAKHGLQDSGLEPFVERCRSGQRAGQFLQRIIFPIPTGPAESEAAVETTASTLESVDFSSFPRWLSNGEEHWWVELTQSRPPERMIGEDDLKKMTEEVVRRDRNLFPNYADVAVRLQNVPLRLVEKRTEDLYREESRSGFEAAGLLSNPHLLDLREQQEAFWPAAMIACAVIVAAGGYFRMQRSLVRERQLNEMKSNFVASISHELRAPVASMRVMAENLGSGIVKGEEHQREYHHLIAEECWRLSTLIENVLDLARIEQNRKVYHFEETDVLPLVEDAVALMQPSASKRAQHIAMQVASIDPAPLCDGLAVQRGVINLIDNAIKFSPERTTITVRVTHRDSNHWEISVADQGPGIPADEQARIFDRFYRIGSELRRETQGAGIGLSIVQHIAAGHGGRAFVESEPGAGSRFTLSLPLTPPKENGQNPSS